MTDSAAGATTTRQLTLCSFVSVTSTVHARIDGTSTDVAAHSWLCATSPIPAGAALRISVVESNGSTHAGPGWTMPDRDAKLQVYGAVDALKYLVT